MLAACGGFLLAVLWMDLIFDTQVLRHRHEDELPEAVLNSIAGYYRRATTTARPMPHLIAAVMVILLCGSIVETIRWQDPVWVAPVATLSAAAAIIPAAVRTVSHAVRLGARTDPLPEQSRLARSILRDHLTSGAFMLAVVVLWSARGLLAGPA
ncbi:hypothetical protein ACFYUD_21220 [Nocardia tengchongensis]|uniref:hypothetical protein n=1 Tax=Nocardia tengchongensis TaxID=2055889 RepID=UPI00367F91D3